jgi:hypothetical protein
MVIAVVLGLATLSIPAAAASGKLPGHFIGNAHAAAATANAGQLAVRLGRVSYIPCPCLGTNGKVQKNRVTDVKAGDLASLGVTESKAYGKKSNSRTASTWTSASISDLDLLDGLITADVIRARAHVKAKSTGFGVDTKGSRFVNLKIAGNSVSASVKPGKRIDLPGLGYVKLMEVKRNGDGKDRRGIMMTMIRVHISVGGNAYGLPVGAEIYVSRARSAYDRTPVKVQVHGSAFDTSASNTVATIKNRIGKAALLHIGCEGTGGKVKTNTVTDFQAGDTLRIDTGRTTGMGRVVGDRGTARTTAKLEGAWLFDLDIPVVDKLIKIDLLKSVAQATYDRSDRAGSVSAKGSKLASISIANLIDIPITVPPNTTVNIPGVGKLVLNKRDITKSKASVNIRVTMLVLVVESPVLGIPVGTRIELAKASAGAGRK